MSRENISIAAIATGWFVTPAALFAGLLFGEPLFGLLPIFGIVLIACGLIEPAV